MVWIPEEIRRSKILVVGAGGIGCELLKNLVLSGFEDITVVDNDTIELSNLNRQLLFQKEHVSSYKAKVAAESVSKLSERRLSIKPEIHSIDDTKYSHEWFKSYNIVLNALDNQNARRHVNEMCIANDIPLIESGTGGYEGQCYLIKRNLTPCFECEDLPEEQAFYPVCTIRSRPTTIAHCVVWSKNLFHKLFSDSIDEHGIECEEIKTFEKNDEWPNIIDVFNQLFRRDILELSLGPLYLNEILAEAQKVLKNIRTGNSRMFSKFQEKWLSKSFMSVLTGKQNVQNWLISMIKLYQRKKACGKFEFDKDDMSSMRFISSTTNIRALVYGINQKSSWDIKKIAGNIIPAIPSSNSVIAGLIVLQAVFALKNQFQKCKRIELSKQPIFESKVEKIPVYPWSMKDSHIRFKRKIILEKNSGELIIPSEQAGPNNDCQVCANNIHFNSLQIDLKKSILRDLMAHLQDFDVSKPTLYLQKKLTKTFDLIPSEDEEDLCCKLENFGFEDGDQLLVSNEMNSIRLKLTLHDAV